MPPEKTRVCEYLIYVKYRSVHCSHAEYMPQVRLINQRSCVPHDMNHSLLRWSLVTSHTALRWIHIRWFKYSYAVLMVSVHEMEITVTHFTHISIDNFILWYFKKLDVVPMWLLKWESRAPLGPWRGWGHHALCGEQRGWLGAARSRGEDAVTPVLLARPPPWHSLHQKRHTTTDHKSSLRAPSCESLNDSTGRHFRDYLEQGSADSKPAS